MLPTGGLSPHDDLEIRVAEALTGEGSLDPALKAHVEACASCGALAGALHALADDARRSEPDDAYWAGFEERLRSRLPALPPAAPTRFRARRPQLLAGLAIAAGLGALALALWILRPAATEIPDAAIASTDPGAPATPETPAVTAAVLGSATDESLELGFRALGLGDGWEETSSVEQIPEPDVAALTAAPAWGDAVSTVAEELAPLSASEQDALARALREAT